MTGLRILVTFLFFLSGICGLVYEVVWSKYLALFIGSTGYSHMIVLAAYMGGLALGAHYLGRFADRISNPFKLYGILELSIGFYCLLYPFLIKGVELLFIKSALALDASHSHLALLGLKFVLSLLTLILPTFLMGGTLPILTKFLCKTEGDAGKQVAILYYANCFGAVLGAGIAGFYLIGAYGMEKTVWLAAALNILIGLFSLMSAKLNRGNRLAKFAKPANLSNPFKPSTLNYSTETMRLAGLTALASGFIAMMYQLSWIRLLSNILGSTTYSFTLMLVAFISGIALGSFLVSFLINRIKNLLAYLAFLAYCQIGTALAMLLTLPFYERLPYYLLKLSSVLENRPEKFPTFLSLEFLYCFLIMLVPTTLSGMSLPIASQIVSKDLKLIGENIGGLFSINTIGSVLGALGTGLIFIPLLGLKQALELALVLNGILGLFLLSKSGASTRWKWSMTLLLALIALGYRIQFPSWNQNFLVSGVFRNLYAMALPSYDEFKSLQSQGQKILWHKEGINANVAIRQSQFGDTVQKTLVINGKADASSVGDLPTQILLGQLPLLLNPNSGDALVIGLGSGITCGTALRHPIQSLDLVEIASEVVEANSFFKEENHNFMADPRVKIHIEDALTFLKTSTKKYDYIISEPSNPWIAGISNLYSLEYFNLGKSRLKPGGVLAQWFHTYDVDNQLFKLVLGTISRAFPHITIWKVSGADIIILASREPMNIDFNALESKMQNPSIARDLQKIKMPDAATLLSTQVMSSRNNPLAYSEAQVNTANKPLLEFMAPVALFTHESVTFLDSLDERFTFLDKNLWYSDYVKGRDLALENYLNIARYRYSPQIGDLAIAYTALRKSLAIDSGNVEAIAWQREIAHKLELGDRTMLQAQISEARANSEFYAQDLGSVMGYVSALVEYYRIENSIVHPQAMEDAVQVIQRAMQFQPSENKRFLFILASIYTGAGRYAEAAEAYKSLWQVYKTEGQGFAIPEKTLLNNIGESYYYAGNLTEAEKYSPMLQKIALKKQGIR